MRLRDLDAELKGTVQDGQLVFDCPHPACNRRHRVLLYISDAPYHERLLRDHEVWFINSCEADGTPIPRKSVKVWQASGDFPDTLTLQPSVNIIDDETGQTRCWHGFVTGGDVA